MYEKPLLPEGFYDLLPNEAAKEWNLTQKAIAQFQASGYQLIRPTMMDVNLSDDAFWVSDSSGSRLAVRSDMTPQISRIAQSSLKHESRPLQLCYAGHAIRRSSTGLYKDREIFQLGIEHIGNADANVGAALVKDCLSLLQHVGLQDVLVSVGHTGKAQAAWVQVMQEVSDRVKPNPEDVTEFAYHDGGVITLYDTATKSVLARGGAYQLQETKEHAFGITLYGNVIVRLMKD